MTKLQIFLYLGLVIIFAGCSASSSSLRYSKINKVEEKRTQEERFTSKDETSLAGAVVSDENFNADEEDPDDSPVEEPSIDISKVMSKLNSGRRGSSDVSADMSSRQERILMEIIKYLNTPYKYGGNSKDGIDCSAFTQTIYSNTLNIPLLRSAREQYTMGESIESRDDLKFGDLVFFNTRRRVRPGHVGIYIGDNLFAHASSHHGVIVSSLDHEYYNKRYMGGRRIEGKYSAHL